MLSFFNACPIGRIFFISKFKSNSKLFLVRRSLFIGKPILMFNLKKYYNTFLLIYNWFSFRIEANEGFVNYFSTYISVKALNFYWCFCWVRPFETLELMPFNRSFFKILWICTNQRSSSKKLFHFQLKIDLKKENSLLISALLSTYYSLINSAHWFRLHIKCLNI